jgi:hypothetical protein
MKKLMLVLIVVVTISTLFSSCSIMLDALADSCYTGRYYGYEQYPVYYHRQQPGYYYGPNRTYYREYYYYDRQRQMEYRMSRQQVVHGNYF